MSNNNGRGDPLRGFEAVVGYLRKLQREEFFGTLLIKFDKGRITLLNQQHSIITENLSNEEMDLRSNHERNNNQQR